jgi:hypothetical protein
LIRRASLGADECVSLRNWFPVEPVPENTERCSGCAELPGLKTQTINGKKTMLSQTKIPKKNSCRWLRSASFLILSSLGVFSGAEHALAAPDASTTLNTIQFKIQTGGDDLRGNSSATAQLFSINGQPMQTITLKGQGGGSWPNNSLHTVQANLSPPLSANEIGAIKITLTSHNGFAETDDNWNINEVDATLATGSNTFALVTKTGNPFVRLTGSAGSVTLDVPQHPVFGSVFPRYQIYALVYAVPGCTSSGSYKCSSTGQLSYGQGSSLGTQVSVSNSLKEGVSVTAGVSSGVASASGTFGISQTKGNTNSMTVTKASNQTITIAGNGNGIDHDQDYFILLTNPQVNLQITNPTNIGWGMGYTGSFPHLVVLTVQDLKNPQQMDPTKASMLKSLGFTDADYATILKEDPLATSQSLDARRYTPVAFSFPYSPPDASSDCNGGVCTCESTQFALSNNVQDQNIQNQSDEINVSLSQKLSAGVASISASESWAWTNSTSNTNTQSGSQSATATVACPSPGYAGAQEIDPYWDSVYGSFAFVPYNPPQSEMFSVGAVNDDEGRPVAGALVTLHFGNQTYRTLTARNGTYRFHAPASKLARLPQTGQVSVGNQVQSVTLRSQTPALLRVNLVHLRLPEAGAGGATVRPMLPTPMKQ